MVYQKTMLLTNQPVKVIESAKQFLINNNFKIIQSSERSISAQNPQICLNSNSSPILFVTKMDISINNSELLLQAELNNINKMMWFIVGLIAFLSILFSIIFIPMMTSKGQQHLIWIIYAPMLPWIVIGPAMAYFLKMRTTKALDTFIENIISQ